METNLSAPTNLTTPPPSVDSEAADNDAVVGRAFWWSIGAAALAALGISGIYFAGLQPSGPSRRVPVAPAALARPGQPTVEIPQTPFTDVAARAGITFVHQPSASQEFLFPDSYGGGVATLDYNSDGRPDLLFLNGTDRQRSAAGETDALPLPALYRNDGNLQFTDVTAAAGLALSLDGTGAAVGDYDNDGDPDLFLTALGPCRLLRNDQGIFHDVTRDAGVEGDRDAWHTSAGWCDIDLDGDLDLFACTYVRWSERANADRAFRSQGGVRFMLSPESFDGSLLKLYRNEGSGLFSDVSRAAGLEILNEDTGVPVAKALGVTFADISGDEWPDILVANDTIRNFAFINQRDGAFRERGRELGVAFGPYGEARNGMGIDCADFRNNGTQAVAIGNFGGEMTALFVSSKSRPGRFTDEAIAAGIGSDTLPYVTFGLFFFDYDLDGRLDLLSVNGHTEPQVDRAVSGQTYEQPTQLFWNCGGQNRQDFVQVTAAEAGGDLFQPVVGRGALYADLDNDGDLEVVVASIGRRPLVLRNDQALGHHWVRLRLVGRHTNRDAQGARVELKIAGVWQRQTVCATKSYLSQCELPLTFGLGEAAAVEEARIVWPGGRIQPVAEVPIDRLSVLEESGTPDAKQPPIVPTALRGQSSPAGDL